MAVTTGERALRSEATIDFSGANFVGLLCSALLLIAFIFMPWHGAQLVDNAAKLMADHLSGVPGIPVTLAIGLIPIVSLIGVALALWGVLTPERGRLASMLTLVAGLVMLIYCLITLAQWNDTDTIARPGLGFWTTLIAAAGMILQVVMTLPRVTVGLPGVRLRLPAVPPKAVPYLFLIVPLILYLIWIIAPTFYTFYLSLTNWDGVSTPGFVGLANYERLFTQDRVFGEALLNNARWLIIFITIPTTMGLGLALIFNTEMRGGRFYKVSFYSPLVLSFAVIGLVWAWVYNPRLGLLNSFLTGLGVEETPGWLGDRDLAIWCVILAAVWRQVGYVMVLYLAGLKNIDPSLVEAAIVDGADRWNLFRRVVLPLLAPVTTIVIVISIIDSLRAFDLVAIMTRGGQSTQVLANFMYMEAFNNYRMGYAAAVAVVLFAISMIFIGFYLSRVVRDELEY
jgi:multiple sugar transport system permease protein